MTTKTKQTTLDRVMAEYGSRLLASKWGDRESSERRDEAMWVLYHVGGMTPSKIVLALRSHTQDAVSKAIGRASDRIQYQRKMELRAKYR